MSITSITAAQRLDSRGKPTVQVRLTSPHGTFTSLVPSGASKGDYEAVELRDGDTSTYQGTSVLKAVHNVQEVLGPRIIEAGFDPAIELKKIDDLMLRIDGTENKSNVGANAILGISMAAARAGAAARGVPLYEFLARESGASTQDYVMPVPFFNVLNGGDHSGNTMAFQEFMIAPVGAISVTEAIQFACETYSTLKLAIEAKFGKSATGLGDEGGFAPPIFHPHEALDLLVEAIEMAGHTGKIKIGIDPAAQSFYKDGNYDIGFKSHKSQPISPYEMEELYQSLLRSYPIILLEDPFGQDDWEAFTKFNKGCSVELVGDDLLATNMKRIKIAEEKKACNSLLLKINQIGSVTESLEA